MELITLLNDVPIGVVASDRNGKLNFAYIKEWRESIDAIPLSLSLPLSRDKHPHDAILAVLWGLLPDNENTLQRWATMFQVSARNPMALLAHVGADCAGAVQFVPPDHLQSLRSGNADDIEWQDEASVAQRLRQLRQNSGASRRPDDVGQFSLAGAQPKTALLRHEGRWGVPNGRIPTTHILKPPTGEHEGYAENEHFCLNLAHHMGLPTCRSEILYFEDEIAISVERYDRVFMQDRWWRIHQEDFCQALGVMPHLKYQNQGGPSPRDLASIVRLYSKKPLEDIQTIFLAIILNWFIAGTDAHAKNYSVLLGSGSEVRLAPLYDISSALPYEGLQRRRIKMAMKVGSKYRWWDIRISDWLVLANDMGIDADFAIRSLSTMSEILPTAAAEVVASMNDSGITHPVLTRISEGIAESCRRLQAKMATAR